MNFAAGWRLGRRGSSPAGIESSCLFTYGIQLALRKAWADLRKDAKGGSPGAVFDDELVFAAVLIVRDLNQIAKAALVVFVHGDEAKRLMGVRE